MKVLSASESLSSILIGRPNCRVIISDRLIFLFQSRMIMFIEWIGAA